MSSDRKSRICLVREMPGPRRARDGPGAPGWTETPEMREVGWRDGRAPGAPAPISSLIPCYRSDSDAWRSARCDNLRTATHERRQVLAGQRGPRSHQLGRRAFEHHPPAVVAGAGAEVDDPVGVGHHGLVVLDHDHRFAAVHQPVQQAKQLPQVGQVQPGGGLVEYVQKVGACADALGAQTGACRADFS
jgi:hypothetical protein